MIYINIREEELKQKIAQGLSVHVRDLADCYKL